MISQNFGDKLEAENKIYSKFKFLLQASEELIPGILMGIDWKSAIGGRHNKLVIKNKYGLLWALTINEEKIL